MSLPENWLHCETRTGHSSLGFDDLQLESTENKLCETWLGNGVLVTWLETWRCKWMNDLSVFVGMFSDPFNVIWLSVFPSIKVTGKEYFLTVKKLRKLLWGFSLNKQDLFHWNSTNIQLIVWLNCCLSYGLDLIWHNLWLDLHKKSHLNFSLKS